MSLKIAGWIARPQRKLRVAFVDDTFWGYVDLPDISAAQKRFEDDLRVSTGGKVSLYKPGSPYRDAVTPALHDSNLHVFEDIDGNTFSGVVTTQAAASAPSTPPSKRAPRPAASRQRSTEAMTGYSHWW